LLATAMVVVNHRLVTYDHAGSLPIYVPTNLCLKAITVADAGDRRAICSWHSV